MLIRGGCSFYGSYSCRLKQPSPCSEFKLSSIVVGLVTPMVRSFSITIVILNLTAWICLRPFALLYCGHFNLLIWIILALWFIRRSASPRLTYTTQFWTVLNPLAKHFLKDLMYCLYLQGACFWYWWNSRAKPFLLMDTCSLYLLSVSVTLNSTTTPACFYRNEGKRFPPLATAGKAVRKEGKGYGCLFYVPETSCERKKLDCTSCWLCCGFLILRHLVGGLQEGTLFVWRADILGQFSQL